MFNQRSGLHLFTAFGIDVFVSLWYLLLMTFFIMPMGSGMPGAAAVVQGVVFAVAVTISLLVHEYGHGFVSQSYDLSPSIMLHAFGGLCSHRPAATDADDAKILLAGPGAGLAFAGLAVGAHYFVTPLVPSTLFGLFVQNLIWINVVWSLINLLLPIWPLDGGKLFHLLLRRYTTESRARDTTLKISLGTIVIAAAAGLALLHSVLFIGLLAFFLGMQNVRLLQSGRPLVERSAPKESGPNDFQSELLGDAREALEQEKFDEAYRLCHQLRAGGGNLGSETLDEIWTILGIAATELGKIDEAESYLDRAPDNDEIEQACQAWEEAKARTDGEAA